MSRANDPVNTVASIGGVSGHGLTIREDFAKTAMLGLQIQYTHQDGYDPNNLARHAVIQADALIAALAKAQP